MIRAALLPSLLGALALGAAPVGAAVPEDLHELTWHVHVDLTDQGAGSEPLSFYQDRIARATAQASDLVRGSQGPSDSPCCNALEAVSVSLFGAPGDGLDAPSSAADFAALDAATSGTGSHAFLVDHLGWCGGPTSTAIGCADLPACTGDPDDDPFLVLVVTLEAEEVFGVLGKVLAHERGHNACLPHVGGDACRLMQASSGGGCLTAGECSDFADGRTTAGGSCDCQAAAAVLEPDGTTCSEGATAGACSGGLCRELPSDANVTLLAAGGAEALAGATPDDAHRTSGATGGWTDAGPIGAGLAPRGLAFADDRGVVFAVAPTAGDDELVTIDPATGQTLASVGTLPGIRDVIALAYDPGPTGAPGDDRLLALDDDATAFEDLLEIDPDTAAVTVLGGLNLGFTSGFRGLAYDAAHDVLYASSAGSLFTIDLASCPPGLCDVGEVVGISVPRTGSALAWSRTTGRLYQVGNQNGDTRTLFDSIDPATLEAEETIGIEGYTAGGLAAVPLGLPVCNDGADNDGDGFADFPDDPGCRDAESDREQTQCQDGVNNDNQLGTDFDGGVSILGAGNGDPDGADPHCVGKPFRDKERKGGRCGTGAELALLVPWLRALRRRWRAGARSGAGGARA